MPASLEADLLLAVDGGGTKTQAAVADRSGNVLARGLASSSTLHNVGFDEAFKVIQTAVDAALAQVRGPQAAKDPGARYARIAAACFGLAGVDAPEDEARVTKWIREQRLAERSVVVNDSELILAGGTPDGWGVALISGTGSICLGRSPEGRSARVGGWGQLLGDAGSGYQVALRALRVATETADGRSNAPQLLEAVLRHWNLRVPTDLIAHVHGPTMTEAGIAGLAAVVTDLAAKGDAAAAAIMEDAARDLAVQVDTVVRRLGLKTPPLAFGGGLLRGAMRRAVLAAVKSELGPAAYVADPVTGGIALARRLVRA